MKKQNNLLTKEEFLDIHERYKKNVDSLKYDEVIRYGLTLVSLAVNQNLFMKKILEDLRDDKGRNK